ncbi:GL20749 [Drosophila persimilis]|uniref:GL20749 n=1 Tax=Drosophila persimilis TaxID=7234 RepID=B4H420_DROPE|nr:GL20749 [Drosophila persimilis]
MECSKDINNIKYTPNISELLPEREYRCEKCGDQVFSNHSHYQLHLRQRHKVVISKQNFSVFHCPVERCRYHASAIARVEGRSFSSLRLVRQHFQKIHLAKNHKCPHCSEKFLLQRDLDRHKCLVHICNVCGLTYSSAAGLRTHMRRKNHLLDKNDGKVAIPALRTWQKLQEITVTTNENLPTIPAMPLTPESSTEAAEPEQTYAWYLPPIDVQCVLQLPQDSQREKLDMETQTEFEDPNEILVPPLRNIETQTPDDNWEQGTIAEMTMQHTASTSVDDGFPSYPDNEPMFGAQTSANMYTQTCDDLFEELGLSHIQTQTHWPDDGLYNTQHTQTCDEMLDELLENFTSTYTQTRWLDWQDNEDNDR